MENKNRNTTNQTIVEKLYSNDELEVLSAIDELREKGNFAYIPLLLGCYERKDSTLIRRKITELLTDVKNPEIVPIIIEELKKTTSKEIRSLLLTVCWSSGLNYERYFNDFVDIVLNADYLSAFEALTVIDNFTRPVPKEDIRRNIDRIVDASIKAEEEKKPIYSELFSILHRMEKEAAEGEN